MMLNPRTRLSSTPRLFVDGYRVGVRSHSDFMNATLYVRGDTALNGVCHAHRLKSTLPGIFQSDQNMKKNFIKIRNPFYALNRISGFGFCYKDGDIPSMGFKAQDVEKNISVFNRRNRRYQVHAIYSTNSGQLGGN